MGTQRILNMKVNRELSDILIENRDTSKECPYFLWILGHFIRSDFFKFARHGRSLIGASPEHVQIVGSV